MLRVELGARVDHKLTDFAMLCWPLYADQKMNKTFMVEEADIGNSAWSWMGGDMGLLGLKRWRSR